MKKSALFACLIYLWCGCITADDVRWQPGPMYLPKGSSLAFLEGNPEKPGPFTVRLKFPANYQIPPHLLSNIEDITVIAGELYVGMGDKFDEGKGNLLHPSSFFVVNSNIHHYVWTQNEVVIQLHGTGPWKMQYVNAGDDPRKK